MQSAKERSLVLLLCLLHLSREEEEEEGEAHLVVARKDFHETLEDYVLFKTRKAKASAETNNEERRLSRGRNCFLLFRDECFMKSHVLCKCKMRMRTSGAIVGLEGAGRVTRQTQNIQQIHHTYLEHSSLRVIHS
jgi:hypothetical protein